MTFWWPPTYLVLHDCHRIHDLCNIRPRYFGYKNEQVNQFHYHPRNTTKWGYELAPSKDKFLPRWTMVKWKCTWNNMFLKNLLHLIGIIITINNNFPQKKEQAGHMHRTLVHHRLSGTEKKCFGLIFTSPCETHLPVVVCRQTSVGWRSCFDLM